LAALVWPTATPPKFNTAGETWVAGMPAPLNGTVCGELGADVVMVSVPAG
jgi:hypothetical protein